MAYDPNEPRDNMGRWTTGGAEVGKTITGKNVFNLSAENKAYDSFKAQEHADAARVHNKIAESMKHTGINFHEKVTEAAKHIDFASQHTQKVLNATFEGSSAIRKAAGKINLK